MKAMDPRDYYRAQPGCEKAVIQVMGSQIIPIAAYEGKFEALVQVRPNGDIGAIGGASNIYVDDEGKLISFESEEDTIRREFREETGYELIENDWDYICNTISVNKYAKFPDVHGVGNYFYTKSTYEQLFEYATGGSNEGKIIIMTFEELKKALDEGKVFANARPAFGRLVRLFA